MPAELGGALFRLARRVPRLDRDAVAFRLAAEAYPDAYALLDARFWCLPTDPAADHPDATAVADEPALAAVLHAQVRAHADAFLAEHPSRGRLPRRALLGAFTDGVDTGLWLGGDPTPERLLPDAALALPAEPVPAAGVDAARGWSTAAGGGTSTGAPCRAATTSRSTRLRGRAAPAPGSPPPNGCVGSRSSRTSRREVRPEAPLAGVRRPGSRPRNGEAGGVRCRHGAPGRSAG